MEDDDDESAWLGGRRGEGAMWWCIGRSRGERCTGICDVRRTGLGALSGLIAGESVPLSWMRHSDEQYSLGSAKSGGKRDHSPLARLLADEAALVVFLKHGWQR